MINLVQNEIMKLLAKKRLLVIAVIVAILVGLFTYAQMKSVETQREKLGTSDWRASLQQQIIDTQNRLGSSRLSDEWREQLQISMKQQQYYLDNNINPSEPGAPTFVRMFIENSSDLFIPLLVLVIASDMVSSEHALGSVKLLLTRPVKRGKILLSKYIALILAVSAIVAMTALISYFLSGLIFGYKGLNAPILTGFTVENGNLDTSEVRLVSQWKFLLMDLGLVWFVAMVVATLSFMVSVLVRSTAAGMGIMLAALVSGAVLANMVSSWTSAKYLFMINLKLTGYLNGIAPPIEGMTLLSSISVLLAWWAAALFVAFFAFIRKDVF
ncbi:ABC transporter permease [Peribacillus saganii]|uniref:ABC transporter permease n=1 Tax=Peribacillus saganii TaxID=2303992 RepID=A0A372LKY2_9BACI|nr:ABC transporter permease [Peribacillus saganii]RFU66358.1 ABC transporter permease [Peribacillus saganii]